MTKDEALKLALEALENISTALREEDVLGSDSELMLNAAATIRVALAQPEQEPVAWLSEGGNFSFVPYQCSTPLYTTPPQRTWVGLTDEESDNLFVEAQRRMTGSSSRECIHIFRQLVEAKLKEKNT